MTLLDMGGLLPRELWVTVWPDIKKPLDAGFATPISRWNWRLTLSTPASALFGLMKYCENGRYLKKI
jgi:hypothetical protein